MASKIVPPGIVGEAHELPHALNPRGWPRPSGYANGMAADGRLVVTGGVIGWDTNERLPDAFVAQVRQALADLMPVHIGFEAHGSLVL